MKRFACLCGGLAVLLAARPATAQVVTTNAGLSIWYDVRPTINEITVAPVAPYTRGQSLFTISTKKAFIPDVAAGNDGGPGDAQVCLISPRLPLNANTGFGGHVTGDAKNGFVDHSVKNLYAYITVESNGAGLDQAIATLGRDTDLIKQGLADKGNKIESIVVTPDTGEWTAAGTMASASAVGDDWALEARSVYFAVGAGPMYDATSGAIPTGVYRIGCIQVTAGTWNKGSASLRDSTHFGFDKVNNLKMCRTISSGGHAPLEAPDFGYTTVNLGDVVVPLDGNDDYVTGSNGGTPEANSGGDGSTIGTTSLEADFEVIVQMKGDFNGDGSVTAADIAGWNNALLADSAGTIRQRGVYLGDFNNDLAVDAADIAGFQAALTSAGGDCTTNPGVDCLPSGLAAPVCVAP